MWRLSHGSGGSAGKNGEGVLTAAEFWALLGLSEDEVQVGSTHSVTLPNGKTVTFQRWHCGQAGKGGQLTDESPRGRMRLVEYHKGVVVLVLAVPTGRSCPIYFDRKAFVDWFRTTELNDPQDLIGKGIEITSGRYGAERGSPQWSF